MRSFGFFKFVNKVLNRMQQTFKKNFNEIDLKKKMKIHIKWKYNYLQMDSLSLDSLVSVIPVVALITRTQRHTNWYLPTHTRRSHTLNLPFCLLSHNLPLLDEHVIYQIK